MVSGLLLGERMKKIIPAILAFFAAAACLAQAPVGICTPPGGGAVQTIANGYIAPVPFASVTMCTAGSTASNCAANLVSIYTTSALSVSAPNPFTSDAGGNFYFCVAHGHYAMLQSGSVGSYFISDIIFTDDWASGGTVSGTWTATSFVGPLTGNASTASASDHSPTQCGAGNFATGVTTVWAANCALPYYQTVDEAGTPLAQQHVLNFDGTVVATAGSGMTNAGLPALGTAGTYAYPISVTTDAYGRVSAITAGSNCAATITNYNGNTSARNGATIYHNTSGCVMDVTGALGTATAGSTGTTYCKIGATSGSLIVSWESSAGATPPSSAYGFVCAGIPPGYYYEALADGAISNTQTVWSESIHN